MSDSKLFDVPVPTPTSPPEPPRSDLDLALLTGEGVERPFRCPNPEHSTTGDKHASASVNVLKGVWYCYVCHAAGKVDSKRKLELTDVQLIAMTQPEEHQRTYSDRWLEWFGFGYYWLERFPPWLCEMMSLGQDPITGEATFPVYHSIGGVAGVGRRTPGGQSRYLYPASWSASRSLFGAHQVKVCQPDTSVLVLVEGAADSTAIWEAGAVGLACYGAGLHWPQMEFIHRYNPQLVITAFDADEAGVKAAVRSYGQLSDYVEVANAHWSLVGAKDPAEVSVEARLEVLAKAVRDSNYRSRTGMVNSWTAAAAAYTAHYS